MSHPEHFCPVFREQAAAAVVQKINNVYPVHRTYLEIDLHQNSLAFLRFDLWKYRLITSFPRHTVYKIRNLLSVSLSVFLSRWYHQPTRSTLVDVYIKPFPCHFLTRKDSKTRNVFGFIRGNRLGHIKFIVHSSNNWEQTRGTSLDLGYYK